MADHSSVIQALAAVADDVRSVRKSDVNEHQRFNFRGIDAVLNAVGPAFRTHGVVCIPETEAVDLDTVHTTNGKASTRALVRVRYKFYGPAGDSVEAVVTGESWDMGDKATAKAYSVAYRTALLQTLTIPTDEPDPDASTYERDTVRTAPVPSDEPMVDDTTRAELTHALSILDEDGKAAYGQWRKNHHIPTIKGGGFTAGHGAAVSAWLDTYYDDAASVAAQQ